MAGSSKNNNGNDVDSFISRYTQLIKEQQQDIDELIHALSTPTDDENLLAIIRRMLDQFQDYINWQSELSVFDAPSLFCRSFLWIGGVRPTMFIHLVLAICGMETTVTLHDYIRGIRNRILGEVNYHQIDSINKLQIRIGNKENALYLKKATLEESYRNQRTGDAAKEKQEYVVNMGNIYEEAEKLRMDTLKVLLSIFTPLQAVDLLIDFKKLLLSLLEWIASRMQA